VAAADNRLPCFDRDRLLRSLECIVLTPQEFREQADFCIDRARTAGSAAERKLYRRLAVSWLEIVIRIEPRAIELRDADAAAFAVRTNARAGGQSRKNPLNRPGASAV
jgi:hypothetical protein